MQYALKQEVLDNSTSSCIGCGICVTVCPMDTLSFGDFTRARGTKKGDGPFSRTPGSVQDQTAGRMVRRTQRGTTGLTTGTPLENPELRESSLPVRGLDATPGSSLDRDQTFQALSAAAGEGHGTIRNEIVRLP